MAIFAVLLERNQIYGGVERSAKRRRCTARERVLLELSGKESDKEDRRWFESKSYYKDVVVDNGA